MDPTERVRTFYDRYASRYDHETGYYDRWMLGDGRARLCNQARGRVLEVAVGTGRNLPLYPDDVRVTGIDLSSAMLAVARQRVRDLTLTAELVEGDAQRLPFDDASFDTVVCTLGLNAIPDDRAAIGEMYRVLRPGGMVLLLGHVASNRRLVRGVQWILDRGPCRMAADRQTRRPVPILTATGFTVASQDRSRAGVIQRIVAVKPGG